MVMGLPFAPRSTHFGLRDGQCADVAAEFRETPQVIALQLGGVDPVEVVGSLAEHVLGDDEDDLGHGDPGFSIRDALLMRRNCAPK